MGLDDLIKRRDLGLLVLRVGLGIMFIVHGAPKLMGGPELWTGIGGAMSNLGITFAPTFWGFMAGLAEAGGGVLLILGLWTRWASSVLTFTMIVAALHHLVKGDGVLRASHAIEAAVVFAALVLIGPGRYSVDRD